MQKRATKIPLTLKHLSFKERLKACNMTTLHYRRIRGDMIKTYKIITAKCEEHAAPALTKVSNYVTRGNDSRDL